jgi:hypothetical protein
MTASKSIAPPVTTPRAVGGVPSSGRLSLPFRVEMRPREGELRIEEVFVHARTIASARHTARLAYPDMVVMAVSRA